MDLEWRNDKIDTVQSGRCPNAGLGGKLKHATSANYKMDIKEHKYTETDGFS